ncbi:hypothetical protein C1H46_040972 [Malus baccata]|uniref:Uncharacterized protein n=1 Tax=Malus baccata TaxID=106549 RepID=A0A540KH23_MALBA|nr:hypothetical protein C1H46_040972 [Malus baccata]
MAFAEAYHSLITVGFLKCKKIQNFMDNRVLCKEVFDEMARELRLLIAISYPVPDQVFDLSFLPVVDRVVVANGDGHEMYVSELMSISNVQSPDIKT